jgi:GT2 family glycosyltransferase
MTNPKVSVIILNWNGEEFLEVCLGSVLKQTYLNVEIVLVDNCSTDSSVGLVESKFPQVKLVRSTSNLGFAAGNNLGINHCKGEFIILLNNDTEAEPNWIKELVSVCYRRPEVGMCASKVKYLQDKSTLNSTGVVLYRDLTAINRGIGEEDHGQYDEIRDVFCPYGAAAMYKREMLNQIGLLDEDYFMFREEDELGWRANLTGWKCIYVPSAVVYHFRSAATEVGSTFKLYYGERNRLYTCSKYLCLPALLRTIPYTYKRYLFSSKVSASGSQSPPSKPKIIFTILRAHFDAFMRLFEMRNRGKAFFKKHTVDRGKVFEILDAYSTGLGALSGQLGAPSI